MLWGTKIWWKKRLSDMAGCVGNPQLGCRCWRACVAPIRKLWWSCIRSYKRRCIPGKLGRRVRFRAVTCGIAWCQGDLWHAGCGFGGCRKEDFGGWWGGVLWGQWMIDNCTLEVHADDGEVSVGSHESMASQWSLCGVAQSWIYMITSPWDLLKPNCR